jgi:hypothetical protein
MGHGEDCEGGRGARRQEPPANREQLREQLRGLAAAASCGQEQPPTARMYNSTTASADRLEPHHSSTQARGTKRRPRVDVTPNQDQPERSRARPTLQEAAHRSPRLRDAVPLTREELVRQLARNEAGGSATRPSGAVEAEPEGPAAPSPEASIPSPPVRGRTRRL